MYYFRVKFKRYQPSRSPRSKDTGLLVVRVEPEQNGGRDNSNSNTK